MTPANEIPEIVGQRRDSKLVICNLQSTPFDQLADTRIFSKADELMIRVMEKLSIPIPPFILHRRLVVKLKTTGDERYQLTVLGVDVDGTPVTFLQSVRLEDNRRVARSEPFIIKFRRRLNPGTLLKLELEFMGHYGEPNLIIDYAVDGEKAAETVYLLAYDPYTGLWESEEPGDRDVGGECQIIMKKDEDNTHLATALDSMLMM